VPITASAGELKNPDVPFGLCAIEIYASRGNNLDWSYNLSDSWERAGGSADRSTVGLALVAPISSRATLWLDVSRRAWSGEWGTQYRYAGSEFEQMDGYVVGARLRIYPFGD